MEEKRIGGLLKFFDRDDYFDQLLGGLVYFNTSESYRRDSREGRADLNESCAFAFRKERGDPPIQVSFAGQEIKEVLSLTMHNGGQKDGWLHCWCAIVLPSRLDELRQFKNALDRMQAEFGRRYVFLPGNRIKQFAARSQNNLPSESTDIVKHGLVRYSASKDDWTVWCKSQAYAYQQEYRFVIGECEHTDTTAKRITCPAGFDTILFPEPTVRIHGEEAEEVLLELDANGCRVTAGGLSEGKA